MTERRKKPSTQDILAAARKSAAGRPSKPPARPAVRREGDWEVREQGRTVYYTLEVDGDEERQVVAAFARFWERLLTAITERCSDDEWSVIYCELWPDSGRVIAYPNRQPPKRRKVAHQRDERVCVGIEVPVLEQRFHDLPDQATAPKAFAAAAGELRKEVLDWLTSSASNPAVQSRLAGLRQRKPFRVYWFEFEGDEGVSELALP